MLVGALVDIGAPVDAGEAVGFREGETDGTLEGGRVGEREGNRVVGDNVTLLKEGDAEGRRVLGLNVGAREGAFVGVGLFVLM